MTTARTGATEDATPTEDGTPTQDDAATVAPAPDLPGDLVPATVAARMTRRRLSGATGGLAGGCDWYATH